MGSQNLLLKLMRVIETALTGEGTALTGEGAGTKLSLEDSGCGKASYSCLERDRRGAGTGTLCFFLGEGWAFRPAAFTEARES